MSSPRIFDLSHDDPTLAMAAAVEALANGGLVVVPTETVYGLGADAENPAATINDLMLERWLVTERLLLPSRGR